MPFVIPNIDAMSAPDIADWLASQATDPPDDPREYHAMILACRYARRKRRAMIDRADGLIRSALEAERDCERTYAALPEWARW